MPEYINQDIETSSDEYDKEGSDKENSDEENSEKTIELWFYNSRKNLF